ncbi:GPIX protein, partial [Polypterus senegalus]
MALFTGLSVLLFISLTVCGAQPCPLLCHCSQLPLGGFRVNCSARHLTDMPKLHPQTSELLLQENHLTTVPLGSLDTLGSLRFFNLSHNHWDCSCHIVYLKRWLEVQATTFSMEVTCSTPVALNGRSIVNLDRHMFSMCPSTWCFLQLFMDVCLFLAFLLLLVLLHYSLRSAKTLPVTFHLNVANEVLEPKPLKPINVIHRQKRRKLSSYTNLEAEAPEGPNLNRDRMGSIFVPDGMDILPQILDTLHTQYDIKLVSNCKINNDGKQCLDNQ